jgi:hypothetical protein
MVLYCAADLLWATRIKATAEALSIPCRPARNVDMLRARLADSDVTGVIVDLEAGRSPDADRVGGAGNGENTALKVIQAVREAGEKQGEDPGQRPIRVLAFGPHVEVELFEQARAAGADVVMARGAFDRRLPEILRELGGGGGGAGAGGF